MFFLASVGLLVRAAENNRHGIGKEKRGKNGVGKKRGRRGKRVEKGKGRERKGMEREWVRKEEREWSRGWQLLFP